MPRSLLLSLIGALALLGCGGGGGGGGPDKGTRGDDAGPLRQATQAQREPQPLLGVTTGSVLESPALFAREVRVMAASGVTALRAPFYWFQAQPHRSRSDVPVNQRGAFPVRNGRPTSFASTDWIVAGAARANIAVLPVVLDAPPWASRDPALNNSPPSGTSAYAAFLKALIGRYGPAGSFWRENPDVPKRPLREWQLWNEPDHLQYWSEQPYAPAYVRLARAGRRAVKQADPGAQVVMAGFADRSWEAISAVYRAGGRGVFDIAAIHPYTFEPRNVLRIVRLARAALRDAGDGRRPLWLTEVTWSSGRRAGRKPFPFETTRNDQAARLGRALPLLLRNGRALGVERIFWENWLSRDRNHARPFNFSGLRQLRPDGSVRPKPAFAPYRRIALSLRRAP